MGRERLDDEIKAIFGESDKTDDGEEKSIVYAEYIEKINHRAMEDRKKKKLLGRSIGLKIMAWEHMMMID